MSKENKVAERIRGYRESLGQSVADLAAKCGVDEKIILSIESGDVVPALGVLTKISRALGQRLGTFMDDQFKPDPIITRAADVAADGTGVGISGVGFTARSLAPGKPDRQMDPFRIDLAADGCVMASAHEGEELVICVSGQLELTYGGETSVLGPGDTAYYNSCVKHAIRAVGGKPASAYGVVFMPV